MSIGRAYSLPHPLAAHTLTQVRLSRYTHPLHFREVNESMPLSENCNWSIYRNDLNVDIKTYLHLLFEIEDIWKIIIFTFTLIFSYKFLYLVNESTIAIGQRFDFSKSNKTILWLSVVRTRHVKTINFKIVIYKTLNGLWLFRAPRMDMWLPKCLGNKK